MIYKVNVWTHPIRLVACIILLACLYLFIVQQHGRQLLIPQEQTRSGAELAVSRRIVYNDMLATVDSFLIPADDLLRTMDETEMTLLYWRYVNTLQILCRYPMRHGNVENGGKEVCIDQEFVPQNPCLVYSFGSNLTFDFEESILRAYGCEIHTFDPSIIIDASNKHKIPAGVNYHEIGIGDRDHVDKNGWRLQTLATLLQQLHHETRVIDILKIDAEGGEWAGLQHESQLAVLDNVKQICIELHFGRNDGNQTGHGDQWGGVATWIQLRILRTLYEKGFRICMREHNMFHRKDIATVYGPRLSSVNELSLVNIKWKG